MRISFLIVLSLSVVGPLASGQAHQENVLDVGSRSQLLLDPSLVYRSERDRRR